MVQLGCAVHDHRLVVTTLFFTSNEGEKTDWMVVLIVDLGISNALVEKT